jgi:RimJ/RimL family protein N-acetyltransferase
MPSLTTPRLRLDRYTLEDVDALHRLWTNDAVRRFLFDDQAISRERALELVAQSLELWNTRGFGQFTVRRQDAPGELLGFAGLYQNENSPGVEIIYGLAPSCWHQGYATEATRAVLGFAFGPLALPRVWSRIDPPNKSSIRVMQRLGLTEITTAEDQFRTWVCDATQYRALSMPASQGSSSLP